MNIILKHGPCDGKEIYLLVVSDTILIERKNLHLYRKTPRVDANGNAVYQYIGVAKQNKHIAVA